MSLSCYLPSKKRVLFIIGILLAECVVNSTNSSAKTSEQWQRIRTPHYDIIFLAKMAREAQRIANTLETLYIPVSKTLYVSPKRIPIILRSQTAISNGFVTPGPPYRGEFFTFPPQDYAHLHTDDWLNHLSIHELRHTAQFEANNPNLTLYMPHWQWLAEGDAVGIETALSKGGRGRSPYFEILYKVNLLERGGYGYYRQMAGSLKYQLPDHYQMGYFITTYLKRKYGANILHQLIQREYSPYIFHKVTQKDRLIEMINPFALYHRCKKVTGRSLTQIYQDTNTELKALWTRQLEGLKITSYQAINNRDSEEYIDYSYPQLADSGIIVLKSGIGTPAQFVYIDEKGQEHKVFVPSSIDTSIKFSTAQNKIVWVEYVPYLHYIPSQNDLSELLVGPSYNAIQSYNIQTRSFKTLVYPCRYSFVALAPDATKLVAFETDEAYNHRIVILDANDGKLLHAFPNPENYYYLTPTWSSDGKYIVAVKHVRNKATISLVDAITGASQDILPYTNELIGCPILHDGYIYYNSSYSGIDNIYAIHIKTKKKFQVTSSKYGAYHPTVSTDGKWLLYNDFSKDGMNAVKVLLAPTQWTPIEKVEDRNIRYYEPLIEQEDNADILEHIPNKTYPIGEYTAWKNFNNIKPQFTIFSFGLINLRAGMLIRDVLGKSELILPDLGYTWDKVAKRVWAHTFPISTRISYKGWYPIISIEAIVIPTKLVSLVQEIKDENTTIKEYFHKWSFDKKFKLNIQKDYRWNASEYKYDLSFHTSTTAEKFLLNSNIWVFTQNYTTQFNRFSARSPRDIVSPWGQEFLVSYMHTLYGKPKQAWGSKLKGYFPGLFKHHSLGLEIIYQHKFTNHAFTPHPALESRDGATKYMKTPVNLGINYQFPICYPNSETLPFVFMQRLRTNLFYDYIYDIDLMQPRHTIGADLVVDMSFLADMLRVSLGLRCMYKITDGQVNYYPLIYN